jgi:hypothetical protein
LEVVEQQQLESAVVAKSAAPVAVAVDNVPEAAESASKRQRVFDLDGVEVVEPAESVYTPTCLPKDDRPGAQWVEVSSASESGLVQLLPNLCRERGLFEMESSFLEVVFFFFFL